ncbi:MAG: hypothetical protein LBQ60_18015, partial [Bacteroidales bacterium]|nr:hypothetical protein [Bacteroidales bacterium]
MKKKRFSLKKILKWAGLILLFLAGFSILTVIVYRFVNPPVTILMMSRSMDGIKKQAPRQWVSFDQMPQGVIDAV